MRTLRLLRDELARGKRAAAASVRAQLGLAGPARVLVHEFLTASLARDPQHTYGVLDRARDQFGLGSCRCLGSCIDDVLLRYQHRTCRVLGARVSPTSLLVAARAAGAVGVVLVSHLSTTRHRALESIPTIDEAGLEMFYAGNAFTDARTRTGVPELYVGTNLAQACILAGRRLQSALPVPPAVTGSARAAGYLGGSRLRLPDSPSQWAVLHDLAGL
jgi:hypothetical protein